MINESKNEAEIRNVTYEIQNKLFSVMTDNLQLADVIFSKNEQILALEKEKADFDQFKIQSAIYTLERFPSGAFTYAFIDPDNQKDEPRCICANCYQKRVISILQPTTDETYINGRNYANFICHNCKSIFPLHDRGTPDYSLAAVY
ncbi:hypothetical protein ABN250_15215 [Providencia stuartii]|uniref:hypothetical protein n=1 Tax=Providencia stuartii TaxID=588 RepID=UPI0032DA191B